MMISKKTPKQSSMHFGNKILQMPASTQLTVRSCHFEAHVSAVYRAACS